MRIPASTYRLQLTADLPLDRAASLLPYLQSLGISDVYLSPVFEAEPGSTHGYDVTDPGAVRAEIGGEQAFHVLVGRVRAAAMGLLLDIVPNHMAATPANPWWRDVLEFGADSPHARTFDLAWSPSGAPAPVDLPICGAEPAQLISRGEITITDDDEGLAVRYHEHRIPLAPASYAAALGLHHAGGGGAHAPAEGRAALAALASLPPVALPGAAADPDRRALTAAARDVFLAARRASPAFRAWVARALDSTHGAASDPDAHERIDRVLAAQPWRLRWWRSVAREVGYRRFFDITRLVGVRVEDDAVFDATHARLCAWVRAGEVTGLRIDHIDGLLDPAAYLQRLRACAPAWTVVEKILGRGETLRADWAVDGTTGYDFLNVVNGWFVEPAGWRRLVDAYVRATGSTTAFADIAWDRKKFVLERMFGGEIAALVRTLCELRRRVEIAAGPASACAASLTPTDLDAVLREVTASLDVYRTYISERGVRAEDAARIRAAFARARARAPERDAEAWSFVRGVLLLEPPISEIAPDDALRFVLRWQQLTGPVMAKGFEDTALYNYHPLAAVNEVGGDPADPLTSTDALHDFLAARVRSAPATMNATSTHDTKRGEDARARLDVLSELPDDWEELLAAWTAYRKAAPRGRYRAEQKPSASDDILLLQTLIATWPLESRPDEAYAARIHDYVIKAARESKDRTTWGDPVPGYEEALARRVDEWLFADAGAPLRDRVRRIAARVALPGALNALSQIALKVTAPGVPDFYQGTELWSFSLVDPDNRRPVDFALRAALMGELEPLLREPTRAGVESLLRDWPAGRIKLYVTAAALAHRRAHLARFESGDYVPVSVAGNRADHLAAFARVWGRGWSLTVVARFLTALPGGAPVGPAESAWSGSSIRLPPPAPRAWRSVLTGEDVRADHGRLSVAQALGALPCAILYADG